MKTSGMKSSSALFLQAIIVLIAVGTLAFLLGEPHLEGRNAHATILEIYFHDPFLAYVYAGSIPFFVAVWRAFGLLDRVRRDGGLSPLDVDALRTIKKCALVLLGFIAGGVVIILVCGDGEDRPAGLFMSLLIASAASVVAIVAAKLARKLQNALDGAEERTA